ncbi:MAG: aminotransferase class I/II-fold pyridoxal phosphate-dependent enzyme [Thermaerobacter sp.]|nr:aminotransferase class I/II-fold pyridoxal phosphate-dependent enzyme [Thermaerobacter sp.]
MKNRKDQARIALERRQSRTPVFDALRSYVRAGTLSFHVPGHKHGKGLPEFTRFVGRNIMNLDLTIMPDLDSIYKPHGPIAEAQELAAEAFGAEFAHFLSNGTTAGIHCMMMTTLRPGDKIVVPRNVHKSVVSALVLTGAEPVYIQPYVDNYLGIAMAITADEVRQSLRQHPESKAILLTNTTFYGMAPELERIVEIAEDYEIPVLVDEAHGAHLCFHPGLPISAMEAGADMAALSTHKLLGSMTQSSLLLTRGDLVDHDYTKTTLNLTQTTSPSYPLLASIDVSRKQAFFRGHEMLTHAINIANWARYEINNNIPGLYVYGNDLVGQLGCHDYDPTKLCINVRALGITGFEIERILRQGFHIQVDLSDLYNVLCVVTIADTKETVRALVHALSEIARKYTVQDVREQVIELPPIPALAYLPREAFYADSKRVPLEQAKGKIVAEMLMSYPPGIPLICPGEILTQDIIDYVRRLKKADVQIYGTEDPTAEHIKIIR